MTDKVITLVEALRTACSDYDDCDDCPAYKWCHDKSCPTLCEAAADMIESLAAELEQVKRERDEMFDILSDERNCADCKHLIRSSGEEPCRACLENTNTKVNWQWRGVR